MSNAPKILVIDDETAILDTLRILLKREGFEVSTAIGGREGLERLPEVRPDVLLSDVRMPGVGGLEILLAAREMDPTLPVILMTAQASLQTAIRAVNEGDDDVAKKVREYERTHKNRVSVLKATERELATA